MAPWWWQVPGDPRDWMGNPKRDAGRRDGELLTARMLLWDEFQMFPLNSCPNSPPWGRGLQACTMFAGLGEEVAHGAVA